MLGVPELATYTLGALIIVLLPGPNSLYVLSVAARRGIRTGYRAALGVFAGDTTLIVLASAGVASLLRANPLVFDVVRYGGAAYLVWIGIGMLRSARALWREHRATAPAPAAPGPAASERPLRRALAVSLVKLRSYVPLSGRAARAQQTAEGSDMGEKQERPFRRALIVSLLNPKAILFLLSFFTQFVDPSYGKPALSFALLGGILQTFSVLYLSTLILTGTALANAFRRRRRLSAGLTGGVAVLFGGFAVKLMISTGV
ncbi:leucine efflux protein [Peterkaempfera griseoplana]|uniref:leucine efflux protein n=1 Tax=Peterkaempfera griseoplana TaxID=66896 RepID=UPI0006E36B2F|nr:leucine efflux protein [Peterkaempfera griseoplana]